MRTCPKSAVIYTNCTATPTINKVCDKRRNGRTHHKVTISQRVCIGCREQNHANIQETFTWWTRTPGVMTPRMTAAAGGSQVEATKQFAEAMRTCPKSAVVYTNCTATPTIKKVCDKRRNGRRERRGRRGRRG